MLVLDMIEILPPLGKYKYDTWRILPAKCYIDNSVPLRSCIRNVNSTRWRGLSVRMPSSVMGHVSVRLFIVPVTTTPTKSWVEISVMWGGGGVVTHLLSL
jgi:hypothetical protein